MLGSQDPLLNPLETPVNGCPPDNGQSKRDLALLDLQNVPIKSCEETPNAGQKKRIGFGKKSGTVIQRGSM